jgi:hypothetical protein
MGTTASFIAQGSYTEWRLGFHRLRSSRCCRVALHLHDEENLASLRAWLRR